MTDSRELATSIYRTLSVDEYIIGVISFNPQNNTYYIYITSKETQTQNQCNWPEPAENFIWAEKRSRLPEISNPSASGWTGSRLNPAWLFRPCFPTAQLSLSTPNICTCWGPGYDQKWGQGRSSSLLNLFSLVPLARFLYWFGFLAFLSNVFISKELPSTASKWLVKLPSGVSCLAHCSSPALPWKVFSSCRCLPFASRFLTWVWQPCAPFFFFSVFYFPLHQTNFHESISWCAQWSPQGSSGSRGLSLLFIACLLHSGYGKGNTTIAKISPDTEEGRGQWAGEW